MKLILTVLTLFSMLVSLQAQNTPVKKSPATIAIFHLNKLFSEGHRPPTLADILDKDKTPKTFMSLLNRLRKAEKSSKVKACIFYGNFIGLGMAQSQELRRHIIQLNKAGKDTYFYSRGMDQKKLLIAGSTKKNVLFPETEVVINGLFMQGLYFKNLLDKLGLEADVIHIGDFKSAGEPFYLSGPSKESKAQSKRLFDDIFKHMVNDIAANGDFKPRQVEKFIDQAIFSSNEALQAGIVDTLAYHQDFINSLRDKYGADVKFVKDFGVFKKDKIKIRSIFDIFALIHKLSQPPTKDMMDKISLTVIEGVIQPVMGEELRKHILKQAKDDTVKAMVLRVNSPGGSALASEVICQAIGEFKKTNKPLIVSMGNIAASGGYYVAVHGDSILAEKLTITGSIGVVGGKLVIADLLDNIGVTLHSYKLGKHADIMTSTRKFNHDERQLILKSFNRIYDTFKKRVTDGRGKKLKGDIEKIAGGRVYTGTQALAVGLIDKIGGLRDALNMAKEQTGLKRYKIVMFPKKMDIEELISKQLRDSQEDDDEYMIHSANQGDFLQTALKSHNIQQQIKALEKIDPQLAAGFIIFIQQLELLSKKETLLIAPIYSF